MKQLSNYEVIRDGIHWQAISLSKRGVSPEIKRLVDSKLVDVVMRLTLQGICFNIIDKIRHEEINIHTR